MTSEAPSRGPQIAVPNPHRLMSPWWQTCVTLSIMKRELAIALAIATFGVGLGAGVPIGLLLPGEADPAAQVAPATTEPAPTREITATTFPVIRVIDGDTFVIEYDGEPTSVRIAGIDTPERGEPGYEEATRALEGLIIGEEVKLTFADPSDKRDNFGRLLARVKVNGLDIGEIILAQGLAESYRTR